MGTRRTLGAQHRVDRLEPFARLDRVEVLAAAGDVIHIAILRPFELRCPRRTAAACYDPRSVEPASATCRTAPATPRRLALAPARRRGAARRAAIHSGPLRACDRDAESRSTDHDHGTCTRLPRAYPCRASYRREFRATD